MAEVYMGKSRVKLADSQEEGQRFMKYVLKDLRALDRMLDEGGWFETDRIRIGAEQELYLIDRQTKAWARAMEILDELKRKEGDGVGRILCGSALSRSFTWLRGSRRHGPGRWKY